MNSLTSISHPRKTQKQKKKNRKKHSKTKPFQRGRTKKGGPPSKRYNRRSSSRSKDQPKEYNPPRSIRKEAPGQEDFSYTHQIQNGNGNYRNPPEGTFPLLAVPRVGSQKDPGSIRKNKRTDPKEGVLSQNLAPKQALYPIKRKIWVPKPKARESTKVQKQEHKLWSETLSEQKEYETKAEKEETKSSLNPTITLIDGLLQMEATISSSGWDNCVCKSNPFFPALSQSLLPQNVLEAQTGQCKAPTEDSPSLLWCFWRKSNSLRIRSSPMTHASRCFLLATR